MHNPRCPACHEKLSWRQTLRQLLGPTRRNSAMWGVVCPHCTANSRVPTARVLLIGAAGVFFGSQSSTVLVLGDLTVSQMWLARLWLIVGFYAIAIFFLLKLERIE